MTLLQLRCFVAVVETGRFSRAAVQLRMAQPGLSLQVANLQRQLSVTLLSRDQTGARPTELGAQLYRDARHILDRFDQIVADFNGLRAAVEAVTLGFAPDCGPALPRIVANALIAGHPGLHLRLVEAPAPELQRRLDDGSLDVSITYQAAPGSKDPDPDDLARWPLFTRRLFYVSRDGAPRTTPLTSLMDRALILLPWPSAVRVVLDEALGSHGVRPRVVAEADTPGMLLGLVGSGDAGTVLPWMGPPGPGLSWSPLAEPALAVTAVLKAGNVKLSKALPGIIRRTVMAAAAEIPSPPTEIDLLQQRSGGVEWPYLNLCQD